MKLFLLALFCLLPLIGAKHFLVEVNDITEETAGEAMAAVDGSYKDIGSYKADGGADYRMVPISVP